ncbi:MAG: tRNA (mnm(5)s(2)U34)-methyltransferase, partial [Verrucomicrobiales bacterium]
TLFLAKAVGNGGKVFAIDTQEEAIESTRKRLDASEHSKPVEYFCGDHADMAEHIPSGKHGKIKAIMFNLGYLPGGDKSATTTWPTTLKAIRAGLELLGDEGLITIVVYPGHPAGAQEAIALDKFATQLPPDRFSVVRYGFTNPEHRERPYLIAIERS